VSGAVDREEMCHGYNSNKLSKLRPNRGTSADSRTDRNNTNQ